MNKLSTAQAAKVLGIHPDTLRRRVRAGKVKCEYDANGHMLFDGAYVASLAPSGHHPKQNRTKIIFVIDQSSSMGGWESEMRKALQRQLDIASAASDGSNSYEFCSITFDSSVKAPSRFLSVVNAQAPLIHTQGLTALYDAMADGLRLAQDEIRRDPELAALVLIVTDGDENASRRNTAPSVSSLVAAAAATDRITVAVNCPHGHRRSMEQLGIPPGNIMEWETSAAGFQTLNAAYTRSTTNYITSRAVGQTISSTYFADLEGDASKVAQDLNKKLDEVTKDVTVERVGKSTVTIRKFAESKFGGYQKGSLFYELKKKETVQPYKGIIIQDTATGKFFQGHDAAKKMLGIAPNAKGDIKVAPGKLGEFKVFIQSTSYNRKLQPGTAVVRLP